MTTATAARLVDAGLEEERRLVGLIRPLRDLRANIRKAAEEEKEITDTFRDWLKANGGELCDGESDLRIYLENRRGATFYDAKRLSKGAAATFRTLVAHGAVRIDARTVEELEKQGILKTGALARYATTAAGTVAVKIGAIT
jgi:hypothetical protein